ncbi:NAD(P)/FAD-dependent oxidoreductase [Alphaproteobacteria bacterium]|nr:NAD(P)/FAD-dependent oxidoreductase [Rhodospirillaceae bacterium]MBT6306055.1 NAD(P)/FAD-dependent oxidoreductase [Rhodospirillaceae bacterium]MDC0997940.1 NAD(P)/FAD-dependent oxidoreductase [Alphaproteobacteria bacterium]
MIEKDIIVIGGGAAGFFAAINIAEQAPSLKVALLERGKMGLNKVRVSGGGRCNVTHAVFIPSELAQNYPRGEKELLGPFHQFMTGDTIAWFKDRGVELKIEDDGRIFPVTNSSQTIIDCFLNESKKHHVEVLYNHAVKNIDDRDDLFQIETSQGYFLTKKIVITTGSSVKFWGLLEGLGHTISGAVPSLFTFRISDERIKDIPGVVAENVDIKILETNLCSEGPLLITHWGMSAPAILKLSAFGALEIAKRNYDFKIEVNFIKKSIENCLEALKNSKQVLSKKTIFKSPQFNLPKRLWYKLVLASNITEFTRWGDVSNLQLKSLSNQLTQAIFHVQGKSKFKEEFVTAGGISLKEIDFRTFESKRVPGIYFAGEVLDIDAVTGGFNFQNAWTGGYIISRNISKDLL